MPVTRKMLQKGNSFFLGIVNFWFYFLLLVLILTFEQVVVRCVCQTLKKEWLCEQVQAAYHNSGRDPKDITKNQFGLGLLSCNSDCKSKIKVDDSDLHLRKSKAPEVRHSVIFNKSEKILTFDSSLKFVIFLLSFQKKEPDTENHVRKRKRRKDKVQQDHQVSSFQVICTTRE